MDFFCSIYNADLQVLGEGAHAKLDKRFFARHPVLMDRSTTNGVI